MNRLEIFTSNIIILGQVYFLSRLTATKIRYSLKISFINRASWSGEVIVIPSNCTARCKYFSPIHTLYRSNARLFPLSCILLIPLAWWFFLSWLIECTDNVWLKKSRTRCITVYDMNHSVLFFGQTLSVCSVRTNNKKNIENWSESYNDNNTKYDRIGSGFIVSMWYRRKIDWQRM